MILIETGARSDRSFAAKIQFARFLQREGHPGVVDQAGYPENVERPLKYEAVSVLTDIDDVDVTRVVVIGSEAIDDQSLHQLRQYRLQHDVPVFAVGRFDTAQSKISMQSKIAHVIGAEPKVVDLSLLQPNPMLPTAIAPLFVPRVRGAVGSSRNRLLVFVPTDLLEEPETLPALDMLANTGAFDCTVVVAAKGRSVIQNSRYGSIPVIGYSELSPFTLAGLTDAVAFFGNNIPGEDMAAFSMALMRRGGVVIDCTRKGAFSSAGAPAVRGPTEFHSLATFYQNTVSVNIEALGESAAKNPWVRENSFERLEAALGLPAPSRQVKARKSPARTLFFPTNGSGLGHAQRCSLIAAELPNSVVAGFAAFPSCVPMLQAKGFDCTPLVQKSDLHVDSYANDILNYQRLDRTLGNGDHLVFDGGYIFDSVYRILLERDLNATWIRRGLWRPGQLERTPVDRERAFDQVIVPTEAFDELNSELSHGDKVHSVGPVVQPVPGAPDAPDLLRAKLVLETGLEFDQLVLTMLGGGVAADRSLHMQTLCASLEGRENCLHLIVAWPNAKIPASLYGWKNTRVVQSNRILELCKAADFVISAVGYNSFHEFLYHGIPAIFMPQVASYMDDQERRARAASERGLAVTVMPDELLLLQREVTAFLDAGKSTTLRRALAAANLPPTGNRAAARLIKKQGDQR